MLRAGASVDAVNRLGATPLWLAAGNGDAAAIARLRDAGANPNVALVEGETPVMTAARSGTAEGVRLLVEAGADVHARETSREQTALMWAVTQGQHQAVQVLLDAGADVEARSKVRPRLVYDVSSNAAVFDQGVIENLGGFTPLLFAARHGDVESARLLLAADADIDNPAANGTSPLVVATHSGHTAFAELLLAAGAEPDAMGAGFDLKALPATAKLMAEVRAEEKAAADAAKNRFQRKRPWLIDNSLASCSREDEPLSSYPSGHATMGYSMAVVLADIAPSHAPALLARAKTYAESRLVCGMHFRADIVGGQVLGTAVALELLRNPAFKADRDAAAAELAAAKLAP